MAQARTNPAARSVMRGEDFGVGERREERDEIGDLVLCSAASPAGDEIATISSSRRK